MPIIADPSDKKDYTYNWASRLLVGGEDVGDTISTSTWTVPTGITQTTPTPSNTTTTTTIWLTGGTDGVHYKITNHVTTAQGREYDRSFVVQVKNQ
jgi:hypothetical protein